MNVLILAHATSLQISNQSDNKKNARSRVDQQNHNYLSFSKTLLDLSVKLFLFCFGIGTFPLHNLQNWQPNFTHNSKSEKAKDPVKHSRKELTLSSDS